MMLKFINISGINQYLSHINFNNFNKLSVCNTNVFFQINCFGPPLILTLKIDIISQSCSANYR